MALGPQESLLSESERNRADEFEKSIDGKMVSEGYDENGNFLIAIGSFPDKIVNEVIRRYKAAGWREVEYVGRGGDTKASYKYMIVFKK